MVCPNCHSKNITNIQGQSYCMNCGQLVSQKSVTLTKVKPAIQSAPAPRRRLSDIRPPSSAPAPVQTLPKEPESVKPEPTKVLSRTVQKLDIQAKPQVKPAKQKTDTAPKPPEAKKAEPKPAVNAQKTAKATGAGVFRSTAKQIRSRSLSRFGNLVGFTASLPVALVTLWIFSPLRDTIGLGQIKSQFNILAIGITVLLAYRLVAAAIRYWAAGATIFAAARPDGSDKASLNSVGFNTLGRLWALDILITLLFIPTVIASLGLSAKFGGQFYWLVAVNLPLAAILGGLVIVRLLARNQVVMSTQTVLTALGSTIARVGRNFAALIFGAWPAVGLNFAYLLAAAGIGWLINYGASELPQDWTVAVSAALLVVVVMMHLSAWVFKFNALYWLSVYQNQPVFSSLPADRQPHPKQIWKGIIGLVLFTAMLVGVYYWLTSNQELVTTMLLP